MPERNEPAELDHDRLIEMNARLAVVEKETDNIRNRLHDVIAPVITEIQAQQKRNADSIGRLADTQVQTSETVNRLALSIAPLAQVPGDLLAHRSSDEASFSAVNVGLSALHDKMSENRAEGAKGQRAIIMWIAGFLFTGGAAIIAAQWAMLSPHLWH